MGSPNHFSIKQASLMFTVVDGSMASIKIVRNIEARLSLPTHWSNQNRVEQPFSTSILTPYAKVMEALRTPLQNGEHAEKKY